MNEKMPILAHGEKYIEPIVKKRGSGRKNYIRSYEEARNSMISDLDQIEEELQDNSDMFMHEKVLCVRMEPKFEAKTYCPNQLVGVSPDTMKIIGGRKYTYQVQNNYEDKAKLYYIRTENEGIRRLSDTLRDGLRDSQESWQHTIQSIRGIDIMPGDEKLMGFPQEWEDGCVEFVIHPLGEGDIAHKTIDRFLALSGLDESQVSIRGYEDGLTFIEAMVLREDLANVIDFNPLRSVHPIGDYDEEILRSVSENGPKPPDRSGSHEIIIGVFDSGIDDSLPYFSGCTENIDLVQNDIRNYAHGSEVAGTLLYGNIRKLDHNADLQPSREYVKMFRVFPEDGTTYSENPEGKLGLYETIDHIENQVSAHPEIKLYNISLGPNMPIIDDELNRFTYALDRLTYQMGEYGVNPLFTVACGNDGLRLMNRIQSPSDMINGLGVGAYTINDLNDPCRAEYSCIGPGREGAKVKPDILEFGGDQKYPFISTSDEPGKVVTCAGTSMAAPLAMHKVAEMMAESEEISPHLARSILIQNAWLPDGKDRTFEEGYGYSTKDAAEMLECSNNSVTILYEGSLESRTIARLPIFAPGINSTVGNVNITWTITTVVNPDINDVDAYSGNGIEDTFYPHSQKFIFRKGKNEVKLNLLEEGSGPRMQKLLDAGYTQSQMPISRSTKPYKDETVLRSVDLKWDTVVRKSVRMRGKSLYMPFITVHAMGRNGHEKDCVKYFIAITIEAKKYKGSLYDSILRTYPRLEQIRLKNANRIRVAQ